MRDIHSTAFTPELMPRVLCRFLIDLTNYDHSLKISLTFGQRDSGGLTVHGSLWSVWK